MNPDDLTAVERLVGGRPPITDAIVLARVATILETQNEAPASTDASHDSGTACADRGGTRAA